MEKHSLLLLVQFNNWAVNSLLILFALSGFSVYGIIIAGWSSNSKYAFLGSLRSAAQMISYEVAISLSSLPVVAAATTLEFSGMVLTQARTVWFVAPLLCCTIIFVIAMLAETNRTPFDLPEAEAELVAGYNIEYSSIVFAQFFLGEYNSMIVISLVAVILFLAGWGMPWVGNHVVSMVLKGLIFCLLFVLVRATLPRYRYDTLMEIGWKVLLPVATGLLLVATALLVMCAAGAFGNSILSTFYSAIPDQWDDVIRTARSFSEARRSLATSNTSQLEFATPRILWLMGGYYAFIFGLPALSLTFAPNFTISIIRAMLGGGRHARSSGGQSITADNVWNQIFRPDSLNHAMQATRYSDGELIGVTIRHTEVYNRTLTPEDLHNLAVHRGATPEQAASLVAQAANMRNAESWGHCVSEALPPRADLVIIGFTLVFLVWGAVSSGKALAKLQNSSDQYLQFWNNASLRSNQFRHDTVKGIAELVDLNRKLDTQLAAGIWRQQEANMFSTLESFTVAPIAVLAISLLGAIVVLALLLRNAGSAHFRHSWPWFTFFCHARESRFPQFSAARAAISFDARVTFLGSNLVAFMRLPCKLCRICRSGIFQRRL